MASLSRTAAAAAAAVAVRSAVRSAPLTGRVLGAPLPSLASPSAARSARILRRSAAAASAGLETLMPLHSAVAAARLRSCIAVDSSCWSSLSQAWPHHPISRINFSVDQAIHDLSSLHSTHQPCFALIRSIPMLMTDGYRNE